MRIIFTGGGTGGHLYPAIAIAREISERRPQAKIQFIIGNRDIEKKIVGDAGYAFNTLPVTGLPRKLSPAILTFIWKLKISIMKSMLILRKFKPSMIMATGGYVSGPPVIAARIMRIPVCMQEQNSYPGITTKKLARFSDMIFLGFKDAGRFFGEKVKTVVTGNPVRKELLDSITKDSSAEFGLNPDLKTVLVIGGSQGAGRINKGMSEIVKELADKDIQIIWQTGAGQFEKWEKLSEYSPDKIKIIPYLDNMSAAYSSADVVVSRAGAMAVAEIAACGLPAIFIPLATAAENHQEYNAESLVNNGAAKMITENDFTSEKLKSEIIGILSSPEKSAEMKEKLVNFGRTDAAGVIAETIIERYGN
ncbi:undecaprenyldiphospho-muramoylpentapeptide beta-N-acetylglucosaminyltransferase [Candidatus Latescibacterota bacterium]